MPGVVPRSRGEPNHLTPSVIQRASPSGGARESVRAGLSVRPAVAEAAARVCVDRDRDRCARHWCRDVDLHSRRRSLAPTTPVSRCRASRRHLADLSIVEEGANSRLDVGQDSIVDSRISRRSAIDERFRERRDLGRRRSDDHRRRGTRVREHGSRERVAPGCSRRASTARPDVSSERRCSGWPTSPSRDL